MASSASSSLNKIERAHQMYRDGQHEEALEYYTEALSMAKSKPQKIALHSNRAACFLKLHDFKKAAEECTLVLELDQRHTGALMLRAQTLVTLREYHSALFDVNRLMELNPSSDVYHNLHSRLKIQLSLPPIPESEEEIMMSEMEDLEELEEEGEIEDQVEYKKEYQKEEEKKENGVEVEEPEEEKEKLVGEGTAADEKSTTTVPSLGVPATQEQSSKDLDTSHSQGWQAIPKPKGHSNFDYSRWDSVEDDSSDDDDSDEDDDEEQCQPQYRFSLKTVGVRPVK